MRTDYPQKHSAKAQAQISRQPKMSLATAMQQYDFLMGVRSGNSPGKLFPRSKGPGAKPSTGP